MQHFHAASISFENPIIGKLQLVAFQPIFLQAYGQSVTLAALVDPFPIHF